MKMFSRQCFIMLLMMLFSLNTSAKNEEFYDLIDLLEEKGAITAKEKQSLEKAADRANSEEANAPIIENTGGIEINTYDGHYSFEFGGRIMIDFAAYQEDLNSLGDGTELRRARDRKSVV